MKTLLSLRKLPVLALLATALIFGNGCFDDETTTGPDPAEAPALPPVENLAFDFDFFQEPSGLERASQDHFFNAFIRALVVNGVTHLVLAPPVGAFGLAVHTVPSPQEDGSWIWVYTWVDGEEEAQIRLRGKLLADDRVEWALRVSSTIDGWDQELWFDGETWNDGDSGQWTFHAFEDEGKPEVAMLEWGGDVNGRYLRFTDIYENVDDSLEYREDGDWHSYTFADASNPELGWFVRWNEADGTGSLQAPDYNEGEEACWDERQRDIDCEAPPAL